MVEFLAVEGRLQPDRLTRLEDALGALQLEDPLLTEDIDELGVDGPLLLELLDFWDLILHDVLGGGPLVDSFRESVRSAIGGHNVDLIGWRGIQGSAWRPC